MHRLRSRRCPENGRAAGESRGRWSSSHLRGYLHRGNGRYAPHDGRDLQHQTLQGFRRGLRAAWLPLRKLFMMNPSLSGKRILLVIGGGIAAYKSLDLIRRLRERGATVRCILTKGAGE